MFFFLISHKLQGLLFSPEKKARLHFLRVKNNTSHHSLMRKLKTTPSHALFVTVAQTAQSHPDMTKAETWHLVYKTQNLRVSVNWTTMSRLKNLGAVFQIYMKFHRLFVLTAFPAILSKAADSDKIQIYEVYVLFYSCMHVHVYVREKEANSAGLWNISNLHTPIWQLFSYTICKQNTIK